ncbi:hypothetical protein UF33_20280 [Vibrio parahaemolyticus]|uniref:hypothetical protein n=1 Tax=Vibrio parahaemolyticus TaxID=670 RepID=UPI00062B2768|nr:hypothetical protein [Vibrio parahaemolyticus]KKX61584.1 hypothetical protein UF33_20280 [Vibrio parahaemolyticus]
MEFLFSKANGALTIPSSVSGEEAISLWNIMAGQIASNSRKKAQSLINSAEYRREIKQLCDSIEELRQPLELLSLPEDV